MRALWLLFLPGFAFAQVNKCVEASGAVRYSDRPCPTSSKPAPVKLHNDTNSAPYIPDLSKPEQPAAETTPAAAPAYAANPRASYRCTSDTGEVWYTHSECPATVRSRTGTVYRRNNGTAIVEVTRAEVTQTEVTRREACKAINAVDADSRGGSYRDEKATTQDKAKGRDKC